MATSCPRSRGESTIANGQRIADIHDTVLRIPSGRVASYGQVATEAGWPGRARLVGTALKHLGEGSPIPWQRVLRADGRIAFPAGDPRNELQVALLEDEGVAVHDGRVDLKRYGWNVS